jgi:hypothetical protein
MFTPTQSEIERYQRSPALGAGASYPSPAEWTDTSYSSPTNQGYSSSNYGNGYYGYNQGSPNSVPSNAASSVSSASTNSPSNQSWAYPESPTELRAKTADKQALDIQREKAASYKAQKLMEKSFGKMSFEQNPNYAQNVALARKATSTRKIQTTPTSPNSNYPVMQQQQHQQNQQQYQYGSPEQASCNYPAPSGNTHKAPALPANLGKSDRDIRREKAAASKAHALLQAAVDPFAGHYYPTKNNANNPRAQRNMHQQRRVVAPQQQRAVAQQGAPTPIEHRGQFSYDNIPEEYLRHEPATSKVKKSSHDIRREIIAHSQAQLLLQQVVRTEPRIEAGSKAANAKAIREAAIQRHKMKKRMMHNAEWNSPPQMYMQAQGPAPVTNPPPAPQSILEW